MINSEFDKNYKFSKPSFFKASSEEDMKFGIDFWLFGIPIAYRKRRKDYDDITIRYQIKSGARTEYIKILNNDFKSDFFIFDFPNKIIFVTLTSVKKALEEHSFKIIWNKDRYTAFASIRLKDVKYFQWMIIKNTP